MPVIVKILLVLFIAIVGVLMVTSRNPTTLTEEQSAKFGRILYFLVTLVAIAATVSYFVRG